MFDILSLVKKRTIDCLDKGFVRIVDCMPRLSENEGETADSAIVQAARVSYGKGTKQVSEDKDLIRYLYRNMHTTPIEMVEIKFHMKMPIFCARQFIRTRTANVNEYSGRYSVVPDTYQVPKKVRAQSASNKQGSDGLVSEEDANIFLTHLCRLSDDCYKKYEEALDKGVAKEQARAILPVNFYTEWYWKIDLHNLLHFLALRCDSHAQEEIREYANAILELIKPIVPITIQAWEDYHPLRGAIKLTRLEVEALREFRHDKCPKINSKNKREIKEWEEKFKKIFGDNHEG